MHSKKKIFFVVPLLVFVQWTTVTSNPYLEFVIFSDKVIHRESRHGLQLFLDIF